MNDGLSDRDLLRVRARFLDLLKSFFQGPPDGEKISRWRGIFAALAGERINPQLDAAIRAVGDLLARTTLEDIAAEYDLLFVDPYSRYQIVLNGSYYLDGRSFGPSLAGYRELLREAQLIRQADVDEPEDSLPLMLDAFIGLIEMEKEQADQGRMLQAALLERFLLPVAREIHARMQENSKADFYRHCMQFLCRYLELEEAIAREDGEQPHILH